MGNRSEIDVLHVDDEPDFAEMAATFLERADPGIVVETAESAGEAIDRLERREFDCVVSDYDMPERNGIELLNAVRADAPDLPFVLFTGKGSEEVASDAISAGVTDYLQKERGTDQYTVLANRIRNAVERYRAENARRRQRTAIETAQEGIGILDENGEFIYVNRAYAELYGYDRDEMVGKGWESLYPDDQVAFAREEILSTVAEEGVWRGETVGLRADGSTFPEAHVVTRTDSGEMICSVQDRSEQEERRTDLVRFRTIVEALDEPVYVLDETGRFEFVNNAFVEMVGYDRETIVGAPPGLIKGEDAVERGEANLGRLLSADGPDGVQFEVEIQPREGDPITCEDHMGILPYEGECFEGSVGILWRLDDRGSGG